MPLDRKTIFSAIILSASLPEFGQQSDSTRSLAGLILKNNIRQYFLSLPTQGNLYYTFVV